MKRTSVIFVAGLLVLGAVWWTAQAVQGVGPPQNEHPWATSDENPAEHLPAYITRLTYFGQRGDWSPDGQRLLFLERTFGDVYTVDMESGIIRPLTHHYWHEGYTRALYLSNGDILLSGAREFDADNPWRSRGATAELWVLGKQLDKEPVPLGTRCSEGPAVSRQHLRIAWTIDHENYPDRLPEGVSQIWLADIQYHDGVPRLINKKMVLDNRDLPFRADLETQNFRPPDETELIFSAYGYRGTEVMGIDLRSGEVIDYSDNPGYEEPEGIFPDGRFTLVESDRHSGQGYQYIDIYRLRLDGSGQMDRITSFNQNPQYKASNPVVRDDGRYLEFQMAKVGDPAGVGRGIFILDIERAKQTGAWPEH